MLNKPNAYSSTRHCNVIAQFPRKRLPYSAQLNLYSSQLRQQVFSNDRISELLGRSRAAVFTLLSNLRSYRLTQSSSENLKRSTIVISKLQYFFYRGIS